MASNNQYGNYSHHDEIYGHNLSRVYINPNFQRNITPQNGSMYVNPQFHQHPNQQSLHVNKTKIYVNPNFIRTNTSISSVNKNISTSESSHDETQNAEAFSIVNYVGTNAPLVASYPSTGGAAANIYHVNSRNVLLTRTHQLSNLTANIITPQSTKPAAVSVAKSRYSLVRKNNINFVETRNTDTPPAEKEVTKLKISKYKTVSINLARKIQTEKIKPTLHLLSPQEKNKRSNRSDFIHSRFKLIKVVGTTAIRPTHKTLVTRRPLNSSKVLIRSDLKVRLKVGVTKYKKNNIPCPLFKKYGTCLRKTNGECKFLHDKKHVSICRKFLKGICHDKSCLLSHEVTVEKMPTCSFYLKGMCTKDDCPYLHVKLNENTKICLDFLNGYCEKGDQCLNRHVNICPEQAMKGNCNRRHCSYPHRSSQKNVVRNKIKPKIVNQNIKSKLNKKITKKFEHHAKNDLNKILDDKLDSQDCRYYREVVNDDSNDVDIEVMKPTRCKLGALPSFIQL